MQREILLTREEAQSVLGISKPTMAKYLEHTGLQSINGPGKRPQKYKIEDILRIKEAYYSKIAEEEAEKATKIIASYY